MTQLAEVASALKSANAGASWITFDIVFADQDSYWRVRDSAVLNAALFSARYGVDPHLVQIYNCDPVLTIKATVPRRTASGGADETDFDGVQQFIPLLSVEVPP